jgi:hypothetical protein
MLRKAAVIAATLASSTALAACGGSSSPTNNASTSGKDVGLKLAECMRTHGVPDFPDPQSGGGFGIQASANGSGGTISVDGHQLNVSQPAFQRAMQQCQKYQPQGPPISGAQLAKIKQGALKMAACMRAHGVPNFPDPKVGTGPGGKGIAVSIGGGGTGVGGNKLDPQAPAFENAQKVCMPLMRVGPKAQKAGN